MSLLPLCLYQRIIPYRADLTRTLLYLVAASAWWANAVVIVQAQSQQPYDLDRLNEVFEEAETPPSESTTTTTEEAEEEEREKEDKDPSAEGNVSAEAETPQPEVQAPPAVPTAPAQPSSTVHIAPAPLEFADFHLHFRDAFATGTATSPLLPLRDLNVRVVGSKRAFTTDESGRIVLYGYPRHAHILLVVDKQPQLFKPTVHALDFEVTASEVISFPQVRTHDFVRWLNILSLQNNAALGHLCGSLMVPEGGSAAGYQLALTSHQSVATYFSEQGLPNPRLTATSTSGRFCFFNLPPEEYLLSVTHTHNASIQAFHMASVHADYITSMFLRDAAPTPPRLRAVIHDRAIDLLTHSRLPKIADHQVVNSQDLHHIQTGFKALHPSHSEIYDRTSIFPSTPTANTGTTMHVLMHAPQWEHTMHHLPPRASQLSASTATLSLYHQGTFAEMARMIGAPYTPALSTIVIEHGINTDEADAVMLEELYDFQGYMPAAQWHGSAANTSLRRTFYFNIPPGRYLYVLRHPDGRWLSSHLIRVWPTIHSLLYSGTPYSQLP